MTNLEKRWLDAITALGCIVCNEYYGIYTPAEPHHMLSGGRRMGHLYSIPLCAPHHRTPVKGVVCRGQCQRTFEKAYGTEASLHARTKQLIGWN